MDRSYGIAVKNRFVLEIDDEVDDVDPFEVLKRTEEEQKKKAEEKLKKNVKNERQKSAKGKQTKKAQIIEPEQPKSKPSEQNTNRRDGKHAILLFLLHNAPHDMQPCVVTKNKHGQDSELY